MRKIIFSSLFILIFFGLKAQENATGEIENAEVIIKKDLKIELPKSPKLYFLISISEYDKKPLPLQPKLRETDPELPLTHVIIAPQSLTIPPKDMLSDRYITFRMGNYLSTYLDGAFEKKNNENLRSYGSIHHESAAFGPESGEKLGASLSNIRLGMMQFYKKNTFHYLLNIKRTSAEYYGFPYFTSNDSLQLDPSQMNTILPQISWERDDEKWYLVSNIGLKRTSTQLDQVENSINWNGIIHNQHPSPWTVGAKWDLKSNSYQNYASEKRSYVALEPFIRLKKDKMVAQLGINSTFTDDTLSVSSKVFPNLSLTYTPNYLWQIQTKIIGGIEYFGLETATDQMPFFSDSILLLHKVVDFRWVGEISYQYQHWELGGGFLIENASEVPLWKYNDVQSATFQITYDRMITQGIKVEAKGKYDRIESHMQWFFKKYQTDKEENAWNLPTTEGYWNTKYSVNNNLKLSSDWILLGGITNVNPTNNDETVTQKAILQWNITGTYTLNKKWSVQAAVLNVLGKSNERFIGYVQRGAVFQAGIRLEF